MAAIRSTVNVRLTEPARRVVKRRRRARALSQPVEAQRVDAMLWDACLALAGGDSRRLTALANPEGQIWAVRVQNRPTRARLVREVES